MDDTQQQQMNDPMIGQQQFYTNNPNAAYGYQNQQQLYQQQQPQMPVYYQPPPQPQFVQQQAPVIVISAQGQPIQQQNIDQFQVATGPTSFFCPKCQRQQISRTYAQIGTGTHILALVICFVTGICCWIPYIAESCQDTIHCCPQCNVEVGRKRFMNI